MERRGTTSCFVATQKIWSRKLRRKDEQNRKLLADVSEFRAEEQIGRKAALYVQKLS